MGQPSKYLNIDQLSDIRASFTHTAGSQNLNFNPKKVQGRTYEKDRSTVENVLDPLTRSIIYHMITRGIITNINGCISTGKEANVYHAEKKGSDGQVEKEYALKVYKTSINIFKDRSLYISGEYRFCNGAGSRPNQSHSKGYGYGQQGESVVAVGNNRKMINLWANKEFRNLKLLEKYGISAPKAYYCKDNVLLMEFIGESKAPIKGEGVPRPLAFPMLRQMLTMQGLSSTPKPGAISPYSHLISVRLYFSLLRCLRTLWTVVGFVHGDLSEYNIMVRKEGRATKLVLIDVSQGVMTDHPSAVALLKMDIHNINGFFERWMTSEQSVQPPSIRSLPILLIPDDVIFEYITARDSVDSLKKACERLNLKELRAQISEYNETEALTEREAYRLLNGIEATKKERRLVKRQHPTTPGDDEETVRLLEGIEDACTAQNFKVPLSSPSALFGSFTVEAIKGIRKEAENGQYKSSGEEGGYCHLTLDNFANALGPMSLKDVPYEDVFDEYESKKILERADILGIVINKEETDGCDEDDATDEASEGSEDRESGEGAQTLQQNRKRIKRPQPGHVSSASRCRILKERAKKELEIQQTNSNVNGNEEKAEGVQQVAVTVEDPTAEKEEKVDASDDREEDTEDTVEYDEENDLEKVEEDGEESNGEKEEGAAETEETEDARAAWKREQKEFKKRQAEKRQMKKEKERQIKKAKGKGPRGKGKGHK